MSRSILVASLSCFAILIHVTAGWLWTPLAPLAGGIVAKNFSWKNGGACLTISWSVLLLYSLVTAPSQVLEMGRVLGGLLGGIPGPVIFVLTILIGFFLGAAAGRLGGSLSALYPFRNNF